MKSVSTRSAAAAIAASALFASIAGAQIGYSGGAYTQNFDTLPTTGSNTVAGRGPHALNTAFSIAGMTGWYGANPTGSSTSTEFRAQDGSQSGSSGRGVVSYGTTGSTDRALGTLATSNQINSFGAVFVNNTGSTLTQFTLSYTGEQWRRGDIVTTPNDGLFFFYGLGADIDAATTSYSALDFLSPNVQASPLNVALDGNLAGNQAALSATITGLNWAPGTTLAIRWNGTDITGQDDGLAVDNVQFSAAIPTPGAVALLGLGGLVAARRRRI